ncbi:MAG TPA: branched-chain amino acid ABC transporter permease [Bacillota bacterium]|mgnify:FL=1|nr:MAG: High-affinity branched-chain amino acid transport system permease protein LivH [Firmicutes bacterium ADurb.Bin153]HNV34460.1 branched-chain amino acid ABC transporter permease [Bacillota bacterium]
MSSGFLKRLGALVIQVLVAWGLATYFRQNLPAYPVGILTIFCINAILALSWNLVAGFTGQFSMGHAGFMAIGAYTSALLMMKLNWPFVPSLIAGGTLSGFAGFLIGFPSLRLVGDYLSVVTLGFQYIITAILNNTVKLTGGGLGLAGVPFKATLPVTAVTLVVTLWLITNLVHSKHGRSFVSVKEDEIAARSVGIDTTSFKIMAFVISSFFAGIGGALIGHYMMYLHPDIFNYQKTVEVISMVILGGIGSLTGSIAGALGITLLPEVFRNLATVFGSWGLVAAGAFVKKGWTVFYAVMFLLIMLTRPQGLIGRKELTWESICKTKLFRKLQKKEV